MRRKRHTWDRATYLITATSPDETAAFQQKAFSFYAAVTVAIGSIRTDKRFKDADTLSLTVEKLRVGRDRV